MTSFKAQAHMRELKQRLSLSIAGATFSDSTDANGNPSMTMTSGAEVQEVHIEDVGNAGRVDGLGLPQRAYSPHKVQVLRDPTASSVEAREKLTAACAKLGMKMEIWEVTPMPASFDLTLATLVAEIRSDEVNPLTQSQ